MATILSQLAFQLMEEIRHLNTKQTKLFIMKHCFILHKKHELDSYYINDS